MNVREITEDATETLWHYAAVSIAFTVATAWLVVAFQAHSPFHEGGCGFWRRLAWPVLWVWRCVGVGVGVGRSGFVGGFVGGRVIGAGRGQSGGLP
jgi:hypothetical protein